jgi:hypothetical protein
LPFWQSLVLQLISPIVGAGLIGGFAAWVAHSYQTRKLDQDARNVFVQRASKCIYSIHTQLSFFERWTRHARPADVDFKQRWKEVNDAFIGDRSELGALQVEIDAYFGRASAPGQAFHRIQDLIMLRYAFEMRLPESQLAEIALHMGGPDHLGFSAADLEAIMHSRRVPEGTQKWIAVETLGDYFSDALANLLRELLITKPISESPGFQSNRIH